MPAVVVLEALAAKEELLRFLDTRFDDWLQSNRRAGTQIGEMWPNEGVGHEVRNLLHTVAQLAEIFAVDPVMSAVVKMAAEDLPAEAAFLPDDLPTESGVLFFGEPVKLPNIDDDILSLDTIMWEAQPTGVILTAWANATSRSHIYATHRVPIGMGLIGYNQPIADFFTETPTTHHLLDGLTAAHSHALAALRIMQQPYAGQVRERSPRAFARRLARQDAVSDITVIAFRRSSSFGSAAGLDEPGKPLDHRVLVRGHWRAQRYKTPDGVWSSKQIYIGPYVRGPEDTPLVVTRKVNDLFR